MKTGWGAGEHTQFMYSVHSLFPCSNEIILVTTQKMNIEEIFQVLLHLESRFIFQCRCRLAHIRVLRLLSCNFCCFRNNLNNCFRDFHFAVIVAELIALIAASTVHRVCITTWYSLDILIMYFKLRFINACFGEQFSNCLTVHIYKFEFVT